MVVRSLSYSRITGSQRARKEEESDWVEKLWQRVQLKFKGKGESEFGANACQVFYVSLRFLALLFRMLYLVCQC